jgi:hypothetical protein
MKISGNQHLLPCINILEIVWEYITTLLRKSNWKNKNNLLEFISEKNTSWIDLKLNF